MSFYMFVSCISKSNSSLLYFHPSHIVAKISSPSALQPTTYLALVSGHSQVVLHKEEADEHNIIKMFLVKCKISPGKRETGGESGLSLRVQVRRRGKKKRREPGRVEKMEEGV